MHGRLRHGRRLLVSLVGAALASVALLATVFVGSSAAGPGGSGSPVTITATNDANGDGVFTSNETIPASATYPLTVSYQVTIDGHGLANAPIIIRSITDSNTTNV